MAGIIKPNKPILPKKPGGGGYIAPPNLPSKPQKPVPPTKKPPKKGRP